MAVPSPASSKASLRRSLRHARLLHVDALRSAGRLEAACGEAANLLVSRLPAGSRVAVHSPIGSEMGLGPLVAMIGAAGHVIALPRMRPGSPELAFAAWADGQPLEAGPHAILQPLRDAPGVEPDVIVAPLIGFDREGGRLGQGAGSYDRAFGALPGAWRIGWGWSVQERPSLPHDPWDVPLHAVVTEREWISCGSPE